MLSVTSSMTPGTVWLCKSCACLNGYERREVMNLNGVLSEAKFSVLSLKRRAKTLCIEESSPVPQPGELRPWLLVGDLEDVYQLAAGKRRDLHISHVLLLCKNDLCDEDKCIGEKLNKEETLRKQLKSYEIELIVVDAFDNDEFDIVGGCRDTLCDVAGRVKTSGRDRILINCYGGVNRAGAASVMILMLTEGVPLLQAATEVVQARGSVLTNVCFRRQLVKLAFERMLHSEDSKHNPFDFEGGIPMKER